MFILALLIFILLAWATWAVSVACYKSTFSESADLSTAPDYSTVAACAIAAVTVSSFIPFPVNYFAALIAWGSAVFGYLNLSSGRGTVLFGYLAGWSVVTRLVVLGILSII